MTALDLVLIVWALLLAWSGYRRGLVMSATALLGWVSGLFLGSQFAPVATSWFSSITSIYPLQLGLAFVSLVLICLLICYGIGLILRSILQAVKLGFLDRLSGSLLGVAKAGFILLVVLSVAAPLISQFSFYQKSHIAPALTPYAPFALKFSKVLAANTQAKLVHLKQKTTD